MATPVFRGYDQKALDAEYDNRVKVKDAMEWIARYGGESARTRAELPMRFDVPYGAHHGERLDIFLAARPGPAPVHVFVHGGYWHRMDKAEFSFVARGLRPAGAITVVLDYGLVPSIDLDEASAAVPGGHRLGPSPCRAMGRRSEPHLDLRPLGRRPPSGDAPDDRLDRVRRAR
jgi:hypothetical protein